ATHAGADLNAWRFANKGYEGAQLASLGLIAVGLAIVVRGALFASRRRMFCQVCQTEVVAEVGSFQYACTNGPHRARRRYTPVILLFAFIWCGGGLLMTVIWSMLNQAAP